MPHDKHREHDRARQDQGAGVSDQKEKKEKKEKERGKERKEKGERKQKKETEERKQKKETEEKKKEKQQKQDRARRNAATEASPLQSIATPMSRNTPLAAPERPAKAAPPRAAAVPGAWPTSTSAAAAAGSSAASYRPTRGPQTTDAAPAAARPQDNTASALGPAAASTRAPSASSASPASATPARPPMQILMLGWKGSSSHISEQYDMVGSTLKKQLDGEVTPYYIPTLASTVELRNIIYNFLQGENSGPGAERPGAAKPIKMIYYLGNAVSGGPGIGLILMPPSESSRQQQASECAGVRLCDVLDRPPCPVWLWLDCSGDAGLSALYGMVQPCDITVVTTQEEEREEREGEEREGEEREGEERKGGERKGEERRGEERGEEREGEKRGERADGKEHHSKGDRRHKSTKDKTKDRDKAKARDHGGIKERRPGRLSRALCRVLERPAVIKMGLPQVSVPLLPLLKRMQADMDREAAAKRAEKAERAKEAKRAEQAGQRSRGGHSRSHGHGQTHTHQTRTRICHFGGRGDSSADIQLPLSSA